jgi:ABC-2 type transport system permease protein
VTGVFAFLTTRSMRNRIARRLRRLREPRYLVPTAISILWLVFWVSRGFLGGNVSRPPGLFAPFSTPEVREALAQLGGVLMFLWAAVLWLVPSKEAVLDFTPAEIHFLFPAPLTRRQIVHYKLLRAQIGILFGAFITSFFWGGGLFRPEGLARLAGFWLLYATLHLHTLGAAFVRTNLIEQGVVGLRRRLVPLLLVGLIVAGLVAGFAHAWPAIAAAAAGITGPDGEWSRAGNAAFLAELGRAGSSGVLGAALFPFTVFPHVVLAQHPGEFARWFAMGVAILLFHYLWVIRSEAAFEEASVEAAQRKASRVRAARATSRRGGRLPGKANRFPWRLSPRGRPAVAILWKNLISLVRVTPVRALFVLAAFLLASLGWTTGMSRDSPVPWVLLAAILLVLLAVFSALFGPLFVRNDLREDLFHVDAVKTFPLSGQAILWGELLAPFCVLAFLQAALLAVALGALLFSGTTSLAKLGVENVPAVGWVLAVFLSGMLLLPALSLAQIALQNGIVLLFPAWVALGNSRARGFEASGQRMITLFGSAAVIGVTTVPAALAGGFAAWILAGTIGAAALVVGAAVTTAWIVAEVAVAVRFLGGVLDRLDPSTAGIESAND